MQHTPHLQRDCSLIHNSLQSTEMSYSFLILFLYILLFQPRYMVLQCAPSCQTCDKIDFDARCPWDKNTPSILKPGDLDKLFQRLTTDPIYQKYEPTIHSSPPDGPWVVTLEKFLTDEECDRLIYLGGEEGYEISKDVGAKIFDGTYDGVTSEGRTSTNAWCTGKCYNDTLTQSVLSKIENITGVPETNSEYLCVECNE